MSVLISKDKKELMVTCKCGCDTAVHIKIDADDKDFDCYAFMSYLNGNWYRDQGDTILKIVGRKVKKIWAIIRNKDFHYSEIVMSVEDFKQLKEYINLF